VIVASFTSTSIIVVDSITLSFRPTVWSIGFRNNHRKKSTA